MPRFAAQIDAMKIPIKGLVAESGSTAPAAPVEGQLWYDTAAKRTKAYQNGSWVDLSENTTYSAGSDALAQAGSDGTQRTWTAANIKAAVLQHAPVKSVAGRTGAVVLTADDVSPTTARRFVPTGGTNGQFLKVDSSGNLVWGADNNTTYSTGDAALINTGTETTGKLWSAKVLRDAIATHSAVTSVAGKTGAVSLAIGDIANLQSSLDGKANVGHRHRMIDLDDVDAITPQSGQVLRWLTTADGGGVWFPTSLTPDMVGSAPASHNHDDRYYTESEIDSMLSGKANSSHTHTTAQVTGLDSALGNKADKARKINTGTGLNGGGDLSADRTLSVAYGNSAGTALEGNQRLNTIGATGHVPLSGFKITGLGAPTSATDAATKGYVDTAVQGLSAKPSVRVATTGNITLSGLQTIDGKTVVAGDRVLVKNQTDAKQNGIYIAASGAWTRSAGTDGSGDLQNGAFFFVEEGNTQADSGWVMTTDGTITPGTTAIAFVQFSGAGQIIDGHGIVKSGNTLSVQLDGSSLTVGSSGLRINASWTGQNSITTVGTISTGTWRGTTIALDKGGTGATTAPAARENLRATTYDMISFGPDYLQAGVWKMVPLEHVKMPVSVHIVSTDGWTRYEVDWQLPLGTPNAAVEVKIDVALDPGVYFLMAVGS